MIKVSHDGEHNTVIIEFEGKIDTAQADQFFIDVEKVLPKDGKGFQLLTDLSSVQSMDPKVRESIVKGMELFTTHGITKVIRVIPDPAKDIGFNILSIFHYPKQVRILTMQSREQAEAHLRNAATN